MGTFRDCTFMERVPFAIAPYQNKKDRTATPFTVFTRCAPRLRRDGSAGPTSCTLPMRSPPSILAAAWKKRLLAAMLLAVPL